MYQAFVLQSYTSLMNNYMIMLCKDLNVNGSISFKKFGVNSGFYKIMDRYNKLVEIS